METPTFDLWLEFELYIDDYDPLDDFANIQVTTPDGRRYAMNVWTYGFMGRAPYLSAGTEREGEQTEAPSDYLLPPDLLVERLDRPTMERVVSRLLVANEMREEWLCPSE